MFPVAMSSPKISVTLADGSNEEISNPLYEYTFHPLDNTQINSTVSISYFDLCSD